MTKHSCVFTKDYRKRVAVDLLLRERSLPQ